jgi:Rrf2 family nitric oxide-sensitive transcriptional repressor
MRLLASTDFALRTLMRLAVEPDRLLSTEALARDLVISRNHLQKVVQSLADAGLVRTVRGAKGGVMLGRPATEIRVGAVVRTFERDQAMAECFRADGGLCSLTPTCRLKGMLADARAGFFEHLDGFTLADCVGD